MAMVLPKCASGVEALEAASRERPLFDGASTRDSRSVAQDTALASFDPHLPHHRPARRARLLPLLIGQPALH